MKRKFTILSAALVLLAFLVIPMGMWGQSDYSTDYTGNIILSTTGGTSASACKVVISDTQYDGIKAGTGSVAGAMKITVPANTRYLHMHVAAWNNTTCSMAVTPTGYSDNIALTANSGIANNSPFTFNGDPSTGDYYKVITFANALGEDTELTFTATGGKRFVIWGVTAEEDGSSTNPSITAANVEIAYDATSGAIEYIVNNPVEGGALTANTEAEWITVGTIGEEVVPFTCNANEGAIRTATVMLIYTYGSENVTKNVIVTQDANPNGPGSQANPYTVAQARAAIDANAGTQDVYATGIVSAIPTAYSSQYSNITFNMVDEAGDEVFLQAYRCGGDLASEVAVGDVAVVYGNLTKYNSTYEFAQGCEVVSLTHPTVAVEAPTFSPEAGTYAEAQTVTISCATPAVDIYYTMDGTDPNDESIPYSSAFTVSETTTIKAIAYDDESSSAIATATYHINSQANPYTVAQALAFHEYPANGIYVHGIVSTAPTMNPTNNGELTYFISDNGEATNELEVYKGKGLEQAAFTAQDDIQVGDIVTIYGNVQVYNNTIEFASGNYLVEFERPASTEPSITVANAMVSVDAEGGEGTLTVTYENFTEVIADVYFCNAEGETATYEWITAGINDDNNAEYLVEPNEGEARTAYFKVYALDDNAEEVYSNLVTINQEAYVVPVLDYAELPFEFDGGRADIATTSGLTQEGLDSDYSSSPKLKFKTTGTWVILHFNERPGTLTFDIKGNSFSGGTFTVQTSEDGVTYTDLENYTDANFGNTLHSEEFTNLGENVRYIKWIYTEKSSGNVALGNIALAEYTGPVASITVADATVSVPAEGAEGTLTVTYDNITDIIADVYFCDAEGETATYEWITAGINDDNNVEYLAEPNEGEARTAYFKVYALDDNAEVVYSNLVTVNQAAPVVPPTGDEYVLYTGELVEGDYVICYNNTTWTAAMKNTVVSDRLSYEEVTPDNGVVITDDATIVWHIAQSGDYWTIYSADANSYAAGTGVKNKAQMLEEVTDFALWSVDGTETYDFVNVGNTEAGVNAYLRNNTIYGFACYAPGTGGALSLYKKVDTQTVGQTLNLGAGYNWVSLSVEVEDPIEMLDQVKAALGDKGITIEGNGVGTEYLGDGEWIGDLDYEGMYNEQMYLIQVSEDCTVELAGTPIVDPTLHVIDIYPGYNWIGFPYSEELDVNEALMGFEALDEDMIESPEGISYYFGEWMGDVMTLVPGQGYLYFSNSEDVKTMTIQTAGKSGRLVKLAKKPVKSAMIEKVTPVEANLGIKKDKEMN